MASCAVTLVIDQLRAAALGSYGAAWCETPTCDRFASRSLVCDQTHVETLELAAIYRSLWCGGHALQSQPATSPLPDRLAAAGVSTVLLTDDHALANHPLANTFDECHLVSVPVSEGVVDCVEETQLASFFAAAAAWLRNPPQEDCCLWLHTRGLAAAWDAPLEFRNGLADPEDPPPPQTHDVPRMLLEPDHDPDVVLGYAQAYAGQVMALDQCLAGLLAQGEQSGWTERGLWILTGCRGFPLGEHLRLGSIDDSLFGEATHVPLMIRLPQAKGAGARCLDLVAPGDVAATLADWFGQAVQPSANRHDAASLLPYDSAQSVPARPYLYQATDSEQALRTPRWFYRVAAEGTEEGLYVKPDDRWEANEVSDRCPETAAQLRSTLQKCTTALQQPGPPSWPPLPDELAAQRQ